MKTVDILVENKYLVVYNGSNVLFYVNNTPDGIKLLTKKLKKLKLEPMRLYGS
jgi:hypothetical protein